MFDNDREFEDEVRRIARLLWPSGEFGGAKIEDGRETDGIFIAEDFVNIIECTVSRAKKKAEDDGKKILRLIRKYESKYPDKHIKGWFITLNEPTADQRTVIEKLKCKILATSFDQFRSKLVDSRTYLELRRKYPFGSVRDPETGNPNNELHYIALDIIDKDGNSYDIKNICDTLHSGSRYILVGDYGSGKSSTLREIFLTSAKNFWKEKTHLFPVLLNLRDHHGQTDPTEAIERHARVLGYPKPFQLVRAWRAGFVILILDGFDEIATAGWAGKTKKLRDLRYRSMELIRNFVRESSSTTGLIIAGREHFFDSTNELVQALSARIGFTRLVLNEFNQNQIKTFLEKRGLTDAFPDWLPARPLLLGYLASRELLSQTLNVTHGSSSAVGWDKLLERISEREAEIEAGIDPDTVRRLIEELATEARNSIDGLGPLTSDQILQAFVKVCGYHPDDRGAVLLQRLPGLGGTQSEDGSRIFIDSDFAMAASAGSIYKYIEYPFEDNIDSLNWQSSLAPLGIELVAYKCSNAKFASTKLIAALIRSFQTNEFTLCADIAMTLHLLSCDYSSGDKVYIKEVLIPEMQISSDYGSLSNVYFQDCIISKLEFEPETNESHVPHFSKCFFTTISGRSSINDLPKNKFVNCEIEEFEDVVQTTKALLQLSLPLSIKVLLTILKKIFAQSGRGRKEKALYGGLDTRSKQIVPDVIDILKREGFIVEAHIANRIIWLPAKDSTKRKRALKILASPMSTHDRILDECLEL